MSKHIRGGPPRNESEKWAIEFLQKNLPENYLLISKMGVTGGYGKRLEMDMLMKQGNLESENREWQWHV